MFVRVVAPKSQLVKVVYPKGIATKLFVNRGEPGATGPRGSIGNTGATGATGAQGPQGIGYTGVTSASTITIGSGLKTFTLVSSYAGAFVTGMRIRAIHSDTPTYFLEGTANYVGGGTLIITVDKFAGSGSHNSWLFAVAGEVGQTGATGATGATGVVAATAPITYDSGTQTVGITQSGLTLTQSQVTNLTTDLAAKANLAGGNSFTGAQLITGSVASSSVVTLKGATSQSGNLLTAQNPSGTQIAFIDASGTMAAQNLWAVNALRIGTLSTSIGLATVINNSATLVGLGVRGAASQSANLQEWQDSAGSVVGSVSSAGAIFTAAGIIANGNYANSLGGAAIGGVILTIRAGASQVAQIITGQAQQVGDYVQYRNGGTTIQGGRNANAQIFTGSTAPLTTAVGGATTAASGNGTTATLTTTSNHNLAIGDRITVAGVTPTAYNGTFIVTAAATNSVSYASTATGAQTVAGTVSVDAQASITARSAGTTVLVVQAAASQVSVLTAWRNSSGSTMASINSTGYYNGPGIYVTDIGDTTGFATAIKVQSGRNVSMFASTSSYGGGSGVLNLNNATTVPTSNATGGGILYAEGGALKWRGSSGTITTIAVA
jgi:hypothetical protein